MEPIQNNIAKLENQLELSSSRTISLPTLTQEENQVLAVKYQSKPYSLLSAIDQGRHSKAMLLKIAIITGWVVPEDAQRLVLTNQFQKTMIEKYPTVNVDEVEYAFRTYGTSVKDWGKHMNLSLIDEVMIPYIAAWQEISRLEEASKVELPAPKPEDSLSDQAMSEWIEEVKKRKTTVEFMPVMLYDWLLKTGSINPDNTTKWKYIQQAVAYRHGKLSEAFTAKMNIDNRNALNKFKEGIENGFDEVEAERNRRLAKQMILFDYIYPIDAKK